MDSDFGTLYEEFTRDALVEDAARADAFPTFPAGKYLLKPESVKLRHGDNPDFERMYDRPYATIKAQLLELNTGAPVGSLFFDVSWEERRILGGKSVKVTPDIADDVRGERLDRESKLWGNLEAAVSSGGKKRSVGDILEGITKNTVLVVSLRESFKTDDGYKSTKDPVIRESFIKAGHKAYNSINSIKAMVA